MYIDPKFVKFLVLSGKISIVGIYIGSILMILIALSVGYFVEQEDKSFVAIFLAIMFVFILCVRGLYKGTTPLTILNVIIEENQITFFCSGKKKYIVSTFNGGTVEEGFFPRWIFKATTVEGKQIKLYAPMYKDILFIRKENINEEFLRKLKMVL